MKVLLNINLGAFKLDEWIDCQGVKLTERDDGSFDLIVTNDIAMSRKNADRLQALLARVKEPRPSDAL